MEGPKERELTEPVALCRGGRLNPAAVGWSRKPLHDCRIRGHLLRKKRWNYWCVLDDAFLFSATVADLDYAGMAFCYTMDFKTGAFVEETITAPLGKGVSLGDRVEGEAVFEGQGARLHFSGDGAAVRLRATMDRFGAGALDADLTVTYPADHETLNVVIPWSARRFQFTSKQHALPADGTVRTGAGKHRFSPDTAFACLDFGRGVWPYATTWNWGGGSGRCDGRVIAMNLGGKWTDGTGMTENGFFIDGVLTKVGEDLVWEYDRDRFLKPWTIRAPVSEAIHVHFMPEHERVAAANMGIIASQVHQLFGTYEGYVRTEDGRTIRFDGVRGWAEEHVARW